MRRIILAIGLCMMAAHASPKTLPRRQAEEPRKPVSECASLGVGYVKLPESDTCIKISGSVRVEGTVTSRH